MTTKKSITVTRPVYVPKVDVKNMITLGTTTDKKSSTDMKLGFHALTNLQTLQNAVTLLCACDQDKLLDFLLLQKMNRKQTSDQERKLAMFMDSLTVELGKLLGNSNRVFPLPQLPDVKKMFKQVEALMLDLKMSECDVRDTKAMYNVVARVLVQHASVVSNKAKIPVTMKLVLQTNTTLHALLDNHFPGYLQAGLMRSVLNASRDGIVNDGEEDDD